MKDRTVEFLPGDDPHDVEGHVQDTPPEIDPDDRDQADVEGHWVFRPGAEDAEDVAGHMQPPRDLDIERY